MTDDSPQIIATPESLFRSRIALGRAIDRMIPDGAIFVDAFGDVPDYICATSAPLRIVNDRSGRIRRLVSRMDEVSSVPVMNGVCSCQKLRLSEPAKCPDGLCGTYESVFQDLMSARLAAAMRMGRNGPGSKSVDMSVKFVLETADIVDVDPLSMHKVVPGRNVVIWYDPTVWLREKGAKPWRLIRRLMRLRVPAIVRCSGSPVFQTALSEAGWWLVIIESRFECVYCGFLSLVLEIVACNRPYQEL